MRRYSRKPFRRRFFRKRKRTEWIQGFNQAFGNTIGLNPVFADNIGTVLCHSNGFLLFGTPSDFDAFQSGFLVNRVVGDFDVIVSIGSPSPTLPLDGAEVRLSYQRVRTYPNHFITAPPAVIGSDVRLHSVLFNGNELGDEEIFWTRRLTQPLYAGTALPAPGGALSATDVTQVSQPYITFLVSQHAQKLAQGLPFFDIQSRHRVHNDNVIFLYVDVTKLDGSPFGSAEVVNVHFSGYARCLITPL